MKIHRLYLNNDAHHYKLMFESCDRNVFYNYIVDNIYSGYLTYDPCCTHPQHSKQIELFDKHFREQKWRFISNFLEGYVETTELHPENSKQDRDSYIQAKLEEHYQEAQEKGYEILGIFVQGSQNYELDVYSEDYCSDVDTKCIVIPSLEDIISNKKPISFTYERDNKEHIDFKDIRLMWDCFSKQNVNFVEILFTKYYIVPEKYKKYWTRMQELAEAIVHAHPAQTIRTMCGMSMEKLKALTSPQPSIVDRIEKYGYDGKKLFHILHINDFLKRYIDGIKFQDAMIPSKHIKSKLVRAKLNKYSLNEAEQLAQQYNADTIELKNMLLPHHQTETGNDIVDSDTYMKMHSIKADILRAYFKEELKQDELN